MPRRMRILFGVLLAIGLGASPREVAALRPIDTCGTITHAGSFILTTNLVAQGDCLIVAADFVTIDLNGYTISGNGTGFGVTDLPGRQGVVVLNGTVMNF